MRATLNHQPGFDDFVSGRTATWYVYLDWLGLESSPTNDRRVSDLLTRRLADEAWSTVTFQRGVRLVQQLAEVAAEPIHQWHEARRIAPDLSGGLTWSESGPPKLYFFNLQLWSRGEVFGPQEDASFTTTHSCWS